MEPQLSLLETSAPKSEFSEPKPSALPISSDHYELRPGFIAMVRESSFSGFESESPYLHHRQFEELCSCLVLRGVAQETLKWKLFPFSLKGKARRWYALNVERANGDWKKLINNFCFAFFPLSKVVTLRQEILIFKQGEKESLGDAWSRFVLLIHSGPELLIPNDIALQHFWHGLNKDATHYLDVSAGGSFVHKTYTEGRAILDKILDNSCFLDLPTDETPETVKTLEEPAPSAASSSLSLTKSEDSEPSPEPGTSGEGEIQPQMFPLEFEDDLFQDFGNTSNYRCRPKPANLVSSPNPLDEKFLKETVRELTLIMSDEWLEDVEESPHVLQLHSLSTSIYLDIRFSRVKAVYDPFVGANVISDSCALEHLSHRPILPTNTLFRIFSGAVVKALGIIQHVEVRHSWVSRI